MKLALIIIALILIPIAGIGVFLYLKHYINKNREDIVQNHIKNIFLMTNILTAILLAELVLFIILKVSLR